jgi:aminoglycoside phosphotransferase (APT) family kinase protein
MLEDILDAARRHGLDVTADPEDFDNSGLDFAVVHARAPDGALWVLRAPRRPDVFAETQVEASVLSLLRGRLPVAVPEWRVHAHDLIAYPRVQGEPAWSYRPGHGVVWNGIDPADPPEPLLDSLARTLVAMQGIREGVPVISIDEVRDEFARGMADTLKLLEVPAKLAERWQRWLDDEALWPKAPRFVHGDLHPGHMLIDAESRVVGLLDWTTARLTDPSVDFAMFLGCFGKPAFAKLVARFRAHGGETWPRFEAHVAERWAAYAVYVAMWAEKTGSESALEHARMHVNAHT